MTPITGFLGSCSKQMRRISDAVILEGVTCDSSDTWNRPRKCYCLWKEKTGSKESEKAIGRMITGFKSSMRISVVIPTYYRSHSLAELLNSLLEQTVNPLEVIVVDDNTPNATIKCVCDEYSEKFSKARVGLSYIRNPKERSISTARNLGARIAKGNIVQFLDSDVILTPSYLREIQKTFENHPEVLGVEGIIVPPPRYPAGVGENVVETIAKLFSLFHYGRNTCKHFEVSVAVDREIRCEWFYGADMAFKRGVFNQFQFDENLKKYSFMECVLFTGLINKAYPGRLILTPEAKCYHVDSREGKNGKIGAKNAQTALQKICPDRTFRL